MRLRNQSWNKLLTALKENRNIREREAKNEASDDQTEKEEMVENNIESTDNKNKHSKDKHKERKEKSKDLREAIKWSQWGKELRVGSLTCKGMLENIKKGTDSLQHGQT